MCIRDRPDADGATIKVAADGQSYAVDTTDTPVQIPTNNADGTPVDSKWQHTGDTLVLQGPTTPVSYTHLDVYKRQS